VASESESGVSRAAIEGTEYAIFQIVLIITKLSNMFDYPLLRRKSAPSAHLHELPGRPPAVVPVSTASRAFLGDPKRARRRARPVSPVSEDDE
jgi:hypothetical protein